MLNTPSYTLQVLYREDLDLVLKGLSLSIKPTSIFS